MRWKSDIEVHIEITHFKVTVIINLPSYNSNWETQINIIYLTINLNKYVTFDLFF